MLRLHVRVPLVTTSADPLTALPVFDASTNVTYANTYCAMCHGKTRDLHLWSLKIRKQWRSKRQITLQDIRYPGTKWEGIPVDKQGALDRCLMTPVEAHTEPDTRIKELCRTYANGIRVNDRNGKIPRYLKTHIVPSWQGQCLLPVSTHNDTNKTEQCQGPRFPSNEFHVLSNDSIFLHPHQKFYPNGSYILVNQSLILCSNFSSQLHEADSDDS
ncbi:hypothetical protein OS493_030922 [Desmophyllum pertusum]|uniref:Uncharacterized protein n=1 Tax=Desmophyllum pertusum TaxID=174260 RepID=A0A9W9ZXH2_9CNID|nr:hypothetical protein OS493_030922 [Desmophyllum pertusum]